MIEIDGARVFLSTELFNRALKDSKLQTRMEEQQMDSKSSYSHVKRKKIPIKKVSDESSLS